MARRNNTGDQADDQAQARDVDSEEMRPAQDEIEPTDDQAANANESRAVEGDAPSWATGDTVPEVMTSRDQRRAGVLEALRDKDAAREPGTIAVVGPATGWLATELRAEMRTVDGDQAAAVEDIVGRIMNATTLEDILADDELMDAEDLLGEPLQIWSFKVNESDYQMGMPGYLVITALRQKTGEEVKFSTGAYKIQAQLLKMKRLNLLPAVVVIKRNEKGTRAGFHPLTLTMP